jgi:CRP-like cAMP-binding protein
MNESGEGSTRSVGGEKSLKKIDIPHDERSTRALEAVRKLDPQLLENAETRHVVELGILFGNEITEQFGTPEQPKIVSGTVEENVLMSYHNGGEDGHTSVGEKGVGVPKNVLLLAKAVNTASGKEIYDAKMRAVAFYAAMAHDSVQLCGRTLLDEGQGENRGDERLSAIKARDRYLEAGGDDDTGQMIYDAVMATAFNPKNGRQNVTYDQELSSNIEDPQTRNMLVSELTAAADLLGPSSLRGPLGAIEYCVEQLCLNDKGRLLQKSLGNDMGFGDGPVNMQTILQKINDTPILKNKFIDLVKGQSEFYSNFLKYSDQAIRGATGWFGITDLFPGLKENAKILEGYYQDLTKEDSPTAPLSIWNKVHTDFYTAFEQAGGAVYRPFVLPERPEQIIEPQTDEDKARALCVDLQQEFSDSFKGAYQFGTAGGADLDLRLCFTTTLPDDVQDAIRTRFHQLDLDTEVDILFIDEQELQNGLIADIKQYDKAEAYLQKGFDPHYLQPQVGDTSLFSHYIFATMKPFEEDQDNPLLAPDIAISNLRLTTEGATGWTHYYTGAFLGEYNHYKKNTDLTSAEYQKRLAKFFTRVTLGSTLAQLGEKDEQQLAQMKPLLIDAIQEADQNKSTDETMAALLLRETSTNSLLPRESRELLELAGRIRSGKVKEFDKDFVRRAEAMLFFNAYQQGIERRLNPDQPVDFLTGYAFEALVRNPALGAELIKYKAGDVLTEQSTRGDKSVFFISLLEQSEGVEFVVNKPTTDGGTEEIKGERKAGSVVGEGPIFDILYRSATVRVKEDGTQIWKIDANKIKNLLSSSETFNLLQNNLLETDEGRLADLSLQYFSREALRFVRDTLPYTSSPTGRETHEYITRGNSLSQFYLGNGFHDILETFTDPTKTDAPVKKVTSESLPERVLFNEGENPESFYVVSKDSEVTVLLRNGETITLTEGMMFGDAAILKSQTTGTASVSENGSVLAVNAAWFQKFTRSRETLHSLPTEVTNTLPSQFQEKQILPRHLLYHLAALGYGRVKRRLETQEHTS